MKSQPELAPGRRWVRENAALLVLLVFCAGAAALSGGVFLRPSNLATMLYQASIIGVLALGQMIVVISGGIDLSMVAVLILSATIMGGAGSQEQTAMMLNTALPFIGFWPALCAGFIIAIALGLLNGLVITRLHIPAFITTLTSALFIGGIELILTGGTPISYPDTFFTAFGQATWLGIPAPTYIPLVLGAGCLWMLKRTAFGLRLYALGAGERAAVYSGVSPTWVRLAAYALSGLFSGIAGLMFLARTGSISYTSGENLLLTSLAAVVVGGIALRGGSGGVKHAASGVLLLGALSNFMNIMVIPPHVQDIVNGAVILGAVSLYAATQDRSA
jgi:ribose/xylose/arabinose/galactoside ABC-type transport system permease subunit